MNQFTYLFISHFALCTQNLTLMNQVTIELISMIYATKQFWGIQYENLVNTCMHKLYTIIWYDVDCINKIPLGTLHTVFNLLHFTISFSDKEIVPAVYTYTMWKMYNAIAYEAKELSVLI